MVEWKANKIYELTLYKHTGLLVLNKKNAGVFAYRDVGDYMGSHYDKIRIYEVYQPVKSPKLRFARRRIGSYDLNLKTSFSSIGVQPELIPLAIEILDRIHQEITGETALPVMSKGTTGDKPPTGKREATPQELAKRIGI